MKRSEMVQLIDKFLEPLIWYDGNIEYNENLADQILRVIEKSGLVPPSIQLWDSGQFPGDGFYYEGYEWESENE